MENTFSLKFGYEEITTLIEFIEDQVQLFPVIETFYHEDINTSFTGEPLKYL